MAKGIKHNRTKDGLKRTLRDLLALHGAPGFEQPVVAYVKERFAALADRVEIDRYGNVTATRIGEHQHPALMLSAHMDEIGFIVKAIEPDGFLRFDRLGGVGDALLSCRQVKINGHFGLIGSISGHLGSPESLARVTPLNELYIDVGASSADDVEKMGIRIGDPVSFIGELAEFEGGNRVCGKGMDDRAGLAILIQILAELEGIVPFGCIHAVATVLEQVGHRGAAMAAFRIKPDYAVAIDGTPAGDTPDLSTTRDIPVVMGWGPVVTLATSTGALNIRGSIAHPAMKRHLLGAAEAAAIPFQLATTINRGSTEAGLIHISNGGIPTISVGVPRRYSYSPHEAIDLNDAEGAVRLLVRFVRDMEHHVSLDFS
ncbi:MAG TPA: M20/M25/M40 family metallo-hydrolase [Alphaproteobacteria bacterium]|nr:M20/M25/M40 family metallo-hydrolase [Alphaproteobacteria bacterium]